VWKVLRTFTTFQVSKSMSRSLINRKQLKHLDFRRLLSIGNLNLLPIGERSKQTRRATNFTSALPSVGPIFIAVIAGIITGFVSMLPFIKYDTVESTSIVSCSESSL
jgi:hypothetical protein